MIGGDARAVAALQPCWQAMGKTIVHHGGPGAGQHAKMVNQALVASCMIGVCESLLYGYKAGLDLEKVLQSVSSGAASSWSLVNYAPRMLQGNFAPGFFVEHFLKDMAIILAESRRMDLDHARRRPGRTALPLRAGPGPRPRRHAITDPGLGRDDGSGVEEVNHRNRTRKELRSAAYPSDLGGLRKLHLSNPLMDIISLSETCGMGLLG